MAYSSMIDGVRSPETVVRRRAIVTIANMSVGPGYALARIPG
jgi:hypothetical protein